MVRIFARYALNSKKSHLKDAYKKCTKAEKAEFRGVWEASGGAGGGGESTLRICCKLNRGALCGRLIRLERWICAKVSKLAHVHPKLGGGRVLGLAGDEEKGAGLPGRERNKRRHVAHERPACVPLLLPT